jgi:hypothetical protein
VAALEALVPEPALAWEVKGQSGGLKRLCAELLKINCSVQYPEGGALPPSPSPAPSPAKKAPVSKSPAPAPSARSDSAGSGARRLLQDDVYNNKTYVYL